MVSIQVENNTFYRKSIIGASSVIKTSPHFPDVAYGQSNTEISLQGGTDINAWLISGQVASSPPVGGGVIKGGNLILYGKSVDLTETGGVPNAKLYKMKDGITYTEGGMTAGTSNANNLAVFAAYNDPKQYTYEENFDGSESTLGDVKVLSNEGSTSVSLSGPYVSEENWTELLSHQANGTGIKSASYSTRIFGDPSMADVEILKKFFATQLDGTHSETVSENGFILLTRVDSSQGKTLWKPAKDFRGASDDESGVRVIVPYFNDSDIKGIVQYTNTETLSSTEEAAEPTANTTIFDEGLIYTTPDINTFYGGGDDTGTPVTRSTLGLSSERFHEGGQSLHMYHLWQFSSANAEEDSVETYFGKKEEFSNQYSCVGMKKIPYPIPIDHAFSTSTGDELPVGMDYRLNLPEIEVSFYLDELDTLPRIGSYADTTPSSSGTFTDYHAQATDSQECIVSRNIDTAYWSGSEGTPNNTYKTLGRNFTITFANYPPEEGESLDAYILRGMDDFYAGDAGAAPNAPNKVYNYGSKYIGALTIYRDIALPTNAGIEDDGQVAVAQSLPTRMDPKAGRVVTNPGNSPYPAGYFSTGIMKFVSGNTGADSAANMVAYGGKTKPGTEGSGFVPSVALSMNKWITAKFVIDVQGLNCQDLATNATQASTGGETSTSYCNQMKVFFTEGFVSGSEGVGAADPFAFHPEVPALDILFPIKQNKSDAADGDEYASSIDWFNNRKYFPNVMCLWATNYRNFSAESGSSNYMEDQPWTDYDSGKAKFGIIGETPEETPSDKQTSVFVDSIKFNNFTNTVQNASAQAGTHTQAISIKEYGVKSPRRNAGAYVAASGTSGVPSWKEVKMDDKLHDYYSPTYVLMGFENKETDLESIGGGDYSGVFMFGGFGTNGFSKILKQTAETTQCFLSQQYFDGSTLSNKLYLGYWLQNLTFMEENSTTNYNSDSSGYFSNPEIRRTGNGLWPHKLDSTAFTSQVAAGATVGGFSFVSGSDAKLYNDAMTQKGVGHLIYNPNGKLQGEPGDAGAGTTATGWFKCEHPFVSAKITSLPAFNEGSDSSEVDTRTFEVDNPSIFHLDMDTQYMVYIAGGKTASGVRDGLPVVVNYDTELYTAAQVEGWGGDPYWSGGGTTGSIKIMETTDAKEYNLVVNPGTVTGSVDLFKQCPNVWIQLTGTDGSSTEIVRVIKANANPQDQSSPAGKNDELTVRRGQVGTSAQAYAANVGGADANSGLPIKQFIGAKGISKLEEIKGNVVTLDTPLDPLLIPENLPYLYISPYKYWVWMQLWPGGNTDGSEIFPWQDTGGSSGKSYTSILPMTTGSDATTTTGSTYNEEKYTFVAANKATMGTMSPYSNVWDLSLGTDSAIDLSTDWGAGSYNEAENTGGYLDVSPVYTSTECNLNLSGMAAAGLQPEQPVTTKLTLDTPLVKQILTVYGNDYVDAGSIYAADVKPYYLWSYTAPVGSINNFTVRPTVDLLKDGFDLYSITDDNLSSVKFKWEGAENVWYKMLMVDVSGATIPNKYHRAFLHVPLNEVPSTATVCPVYKFYDYNARVGTSFRGSGSVTTGSRCRGDIQGACGYAFRPNQVAGGAISIAGGTNLSADESPGFGDSKTEFTFVIHITPDARSGSPGVQNIMAQGDGTNSATLNLDESSGFITFTFTNSTPTAYTLTSKSSAAFDGETPMSIVVTYKTNSQAGPDMQMFIDGNREDYLQTVTGSITITPDINIGSNHTPTTAAIFRGTIEEFIIYDRAYYVPEDKGSYVLNTADINDAASNKKLTHNARLFVYDYHNIRGTTKDKVATSSEANWGATTL